MGNRRGQVATEYLMITAFVLITVLGAIYYFYPYLSSPERASADAQAQLMANVMLDTANKLFFLGSPSRTTITLVLPANLKSIEVHNRSELVLTYETDVGLQERAFMSRVPIGLNINRLGRGKRKVVFQAKDDAVSICVIESDFCNCDGICNRPEENYTHCSSDCCASTQNRDAPSGTPCRGCDNSSTEYLSSYSCSITDDTQWQVCNGHNGCDCSVVGVSCT